MIHPAYAYIFPIFYSKSSNETHKFKTKLSKQIKKLLYNYLQKLFGTLKISLILRSKLNFQFLNFKRYEEKKSLGQNDFRMIILLILHSHAIAMRDMVALQLVYVTQLHCDDDVWCCGALLLRLLY